MMEMEKEDGYFACERPSDQDEGGVSGVVRSFGECFKAMWCHDSMGPKPESRVLSPLYARW